MSVHRNRHGHEEGVMLLSQRRSVAEIMDEPGLDPRRHAHALRGLARINFWSGSARILWPPLADLARRLSPRRPRVLDLATGGGDVPIRLWRRARRAGLELELEGCDVSEVALAYARDCAERAGAPVRFFELDLLRDPIPLGYDAITCSLFLHHLDEDQACDLLRGMAGAARHLVLVNDLERCWAGLALAHLATRLLTTSAVVHTDGPRSVARAYKRAEARALAERAGLRGAVVSRRWPFRYLLSWSRP
jgi:2-polyprenyl-3-methyl-5-hydroxy-6-metoxy-1,4-benzoquinol methylase